MSGWSDIFSTGPAVDPTFQDSVAAGPQVDGTFVIPAAAQPNNLPVDSGAPVPGSYSGDVTDIFKYGLAALTTVGNYNLAKTQIDYKRFEATNGGVFQQGQAASVPRVASGGLSSGYLLAVGAVVLALVLTTHRHV